MNMNEPKKQSDGSRALSMVNLKMTLVLRPDEKKPQEWEIKADSMVQAVARYRKICKDNGRKVSDIQRLETM